MDLQKNIILVLCGGRSGEREVSLMSGYNIFSNLSKSKYQASLVEISIGGDWYEMLRTRRTRVQEVKNYLKGFDVVFIALHGSDGENGEIQQFLESAGIRYTCSGVKASKIAIDKDRTSKLVQRIGVVSPKTIVLHRGDKVDDSVVKIKVGYPCVVKPNSGGSSVATTIIHDAKSVKCAASIAFKEDKKVLVQELIKGREFTCPVLGNRGQKLTPLPVLEIICDGQFFDYKAKYQSKKTREIAPKDTDSKIIRKIQRQSIAVHRALGCDGLTRSDFILGNDGELYFLEINTIPGMTKASLCPKSAKIAGMSFGDLLDKIIQLSVATSTT